MNITNALMCQGCMEPEELIWLAVQAEKHRCIVEVGSFLGRSTRALADNTPGVVVAFDDWFGPRDIPMEGREHVYEVFRRNMNGLVESGKVLIMSADHGDLSSFPPGLEPDMVFIDGDHEYESVKRDILNWKDKLAPGGLFCGHDAQHPPVQQALNELLPGWKVACTANVGTTIWGMDNGS